VAAGLAVARLLGADPVPPEGAFAAVGTGLLAGGAVLGIAVAVVMATARGPLAAALASLRAPDRQEVLR
jgi:putative peptidoglycan lipid II flippase